MACLSRAERRALLRPDGEGTNGPERRSVDEVGAVHFPTIHHL